MDTVNKEMATCESCNVTMTRKHLTKHSRRCHSASGKHSRRGKERTENNVLTVEKILCEFCNEQISVNDWESHLETCTSEHRRRIENLQSDIANEPIDILVPCEICDKQIHVNDLESHTRRCANEKRLYEQKLNENELIFIPCEYCKNSVSHLELEWHTYHCLKTKQATMKDKDLADYVMVDIDDDDDARIPCQFCEKCYSIKTIESHQKECRREQQQQQPTFVPDALQAQIHTNATEFPQEWDLSAIENLTRYILDPATAEYKFVARNFHRTLPSNQVVQIERIQNRRWYRQYDAQKEDFIDRYGWSTEDWLFHGCRKAESAEAITRDCFNRSHATNCAVGRGIYFATEAQISHGYTTPDTRGHRHMFMARVLIGRTTTGNSATKVCPPGFDTTGGSNVFVTYHDAQAYGEYLIVYK